MKFENNFASLQNFRCPDWFRDAKFGIWSHWGPQSVPMAGDWYARNMYIQGSEQYNYHVSHYGHPSEFGYLDICKLWKAEKFDPEELMALYYKAGARYFVAQAMHHDNFFNYESKYNRFNSQQIGPNKDICMLWKRAADKYNMPFGLTEHLAASYNWWYTNKGSDHYGPFKDIPYDGNKIEYNDFYHDNKEVTNYMLQHNKFGDFAPQWMTNNLKFQNYWKNCMYELIDKFKPELLYSDSALPFQQDDDKSTNYEPGLDVIKYLYNTSIDKHGSNQAIYTQKDRKQEVFSVGILDIEKSQLPCIQSDPWQTDTCIANWFYDARTSYKKPDQIIEMLIDIISKNGTMLLNIIQRPDGTIDQEARYILEELAGWFSVCGDAIYNTRPYQQYGEGDTKVEINGFTENKTKWNTSDFRFVQKDGNIYAFIMKAPKNRTIIIKTLLEELKVNKISLLGYGEVQYQQSYGTLIIKLPDNLPTIYTNCIKIHTS